MATGHVPSLTFALGLVCGDNSSTYVGRRWKKFDRYNVNMANRNIRFEREEGYLSSDVYAQVLSGLRQIYFGV